SSLSNHAIVKAINSRSIAKGDLTLLICGITAAILTAGGGAVLVSRILYRRLREKRRQRSLGLSPCLSLVDNMGGRRKGEGRSRKDENMERDMELQYPFSATFSGDGKRNVGYAEVEQEGLGVHFMDVDLDDDAGYGRRGKLRR
ncbi:MAG: hypothetical protein Q9208_008822, partial [Pyrenodesmia sp. 3 TL-2023]